MPDRARDWLRQAERDLEQAEDLHRLGRHEGAPFEQYGPLQSEEAIRYAHEILGFVRIQMAGPEGQ